MTKRLVDIDDRLLEEATKILEVDTMKDAVNGALRETVALAQRRRRLERLRTMDGLELDDPEVMAGAWR